LQSAYLFAMAKWIQQNNKNPIEEQCNNKKIVEDLRAITMKTFWQRKYNQTPILWTNNSQQ
jgi:hypothetical protein